LSSAWLSDFGGLAESRCAKAYDKGAKGIEDRWDVLRESTEVAKEQNRLLQKEMEIMGELIVALRKRK